ncbi:hypothetical protein J4403_00495 [Candidatus Woesearchaeota archaeon]|nr:hypothetical protein [Candidatus Woesearchaeota archaeon]
MPEASSVTPPTSPKGSGFLSFLGGAVKEKIKNKIESGESKTKEHKPIHIPINLIIFVLFVLLIIGFFTLGSDSGWTQTTLQPLKNLYDDAIKPFVKSGVEGLEETSRMITEGPSYQFKSSNTKNSEKTGIELGKAEVVSGINGGFISSTSPLRVRSKIEINQLDENIKSIPAEISCEMDNSSGELKTGFPQRKVGSKQIVTYPNTGEPYEDTATCTFKQTTSEEFRKNLISYNSKDIYFTLTYYFENFAELDINIVSPDVDYSLSPKDRKQIPSIMNYKSDLDISLYFDSQPVVAEGMSKDGSLSDGLTYLNLGLINKKQDTEVKINSLSLELPKGVSLQDYSDYFEAKQNSYSLKDTEIKKWENSLKKGQKAYISVPVQVSELALGGSKQTLGAPVTLKARLIANYAYKLKEKTTINMNSIDSTKEKSAELLI